jgi:hypothetical protein
VLGAAPGYAAGDGNETKIHSVIYNHKDNRSGVLAAASFSHLESPVLLDF